MTDRRHHTSRAAPHVEGAAGRLAETLRAEGRHVDEVSQARFERALYEAWRVRDGADLADRPARRRSRRPVVAFWGASVAGAAVAGALLAVVLWRQPAAAPPNLTAAQYELRIGDGGLQRGHLQQGETLESGAHGQVDVTVGFGRVEMGQRGALRFDRISEQALDVTLLRGRVEVAFHPPYRGAQTLAIATRAARVRVVGTRFSVDVDGRGNTVVVVTEGVVEVTSRVDGTVHRVAAGERLEVQTDPGDAVERAVRDALTEELAAPGEGAPDEREADMDLSELLPSPAPAPSVRAVTPRARPVPTLQSARALLRSGKHAGARTALGVIARSAASAATRAEAHTLMAESFTAQGQVPRAEQAYAEAVKAAPRQPAGHNALFALGRLRERYEQDVPGAMQAYRDYLSRAPRGPLAPQARRALCRLGDTAYCP